MSNQIHTDILHRIVEVNAPVLATARRQLPAKKLEALSEQTPPPPSFVEALEAKVRLGIPAVIAELKSASPSRGTIRSPLECAALAPQLEEAGAACLSVLTEPFFFHGSLDNLRTARAHCALPLLRKDFIVEEYQILQARAAGASAILLIAALLPQKRLCELAAFAHRHALQVLAEAHTEEEVTRLLDSPADAIGVNARDLHTFRTSLETVQAFLQRIPKERHPVAESAITTPQELRKLLAAGADAFLIGTELMQAPSPAQRLRELLGRDGH